MPDPNPDVDVEFDKESNYDYIHAGYDINDPDIVCTHIFTPSAHLQPNPPYSGQQCQSI